MPNGPGETALRQARAGMAKEPGGTGAAEKIMADEEGSSMADKLSPLDYLLHRGESHPVTRSAFLGLEILDRPADWNRLREAIDRASRVVIRMRQKVVVPPVPTTPPQWVVDPDFDLDYHLRRVALPAPGTLRQLLDLAEVTLQSPLDTSRALWEAVYVEWLEGGRAALPPLLRRRSLVTRTHVLEVPLADLRGAAKAVGASVNDAYLAALCGALGRYHEALGVPIDALPLALPVSLRAGDDPASGNRWAGVTIAAPIGESDPAERIRLIREQVIERRSEPAIDVIGRIAPVLGLLPDGALQSVIERITPPDIQASNVPGYSQETFLAGA